MDAQFVADDDDRVTRETAPDPRPPVRVAPATANQTNILRAPLVPVACFRIGDVRFDFDASFPRPEAAGELLLLSLLRETHPQAPLAIFGHADPVGDDVYNKRLSGRRALAVYALLLRDPDLWEQLYSSPQGNDRWGLRRIQSMLAALAYEPGPVDGVDGDLTRGAVRRFQEDNGLTVDGVAGPNTRGKLFTAYMDLLCQDWQGQPFRLAPEDFLAQGGDAAGRGAVHGCGEHNPALVFSTQEAQQLDSDREERNRRNAPNRRVEVFLFRPGSAISPERWPCPSVQEGPQRCRQRFWRDGDSRRSPQAKHREYPDTRDTYACRFYDRLTWAVRGNDVPAPTIGAFFGRPAAHDQRPEEPHRTLIPKGSSVFLHWRVENVQQLHVVAMTLDGTISHWRQRADPKAANPSLPDRIQVGPQEDTVYTLFAAGPGGVVQHHRQVHVFFHGQIQPGAATAVRVGADLLEEYLSP